MRRWPVAALCKAVLPCMVVCLCTGWNARERAEMWGARTSIEVRVVDDQEVVVTKAGLSDPN